MPTGAFFQKKLVKNETAFSRKHNFVLKIVSGKSHFIQGQLNLIRISSSLIYGKLWKGRLKNVENCREGRLKMSKIVKGV